MNIACWASALTVVAGVACTSAPTSTAMATCTDSVSGTPVPCYLKIDSVSGTTGRVARPVMELSAVLSAGGAAVPLSAVTAACRNVATGAPVNCRLALVVDSSQTATTNLQAPSDSVSGTPGRDSTK